MPLISEQFKDIVKRRGDRQHNGKKKQKTAITAVLLKNNPSLADKY